MFEKAEVLDRRKHAGFRFKPITDYRFAGSVVAGPVSMSEMQRASREFPIVFPPVGRQVPLAYFGVREKSNSFVTENKEWRADYIPAHIRRYPFVLGDKGDGDNFYVMVDPRGLCFDGDAELLFDETTSKADAGEGVIDRVTEFLVNFERELAATQSLVVPLYETAVLVNQTVTVEKPGSQGARVTGFKVVDRQRLRALDDVTLATWERTGLLELVTLHLASQENWARLMPV